MTVGVVGAGVTGLALGHHLDREGREWVAFEADDRPGGVVRSEELAGHVVEVGPHRIRATDPVRELVGDLGLGDELIEADDDLPLYVYHRGKLRVVPRSVGEFVRTDLVSARGKLRALGEPLAAPGDGGETAADLFRRKFGPEVYHNVVEPLFSGIYASDPERMPARHSLSGLLRIDEREGGLLGPALRRLAAGGSTAPPVSFEGGLGRLPGALYDAHADRIHLSTPVESVVPAGDGGADDGYLVRAGGDERRVDDVVVTAPAGAAADVFREAFPEATDRLDRLAYNPLAMVYLEADVDREGFGYQVHADEALRTRGVTFVDSLFGRENLYTAFLGGMSDPDVLEESDRALERTAAEEFEAVLGAPAEPIGVNRLRAYPAYDDSWAALDGLELPEGIHLATNYTARLGVPSRIRESKRLAADLAAGAGERTAPAPP
jgi:oxygen-dependent protoporphyrinogen oxidase